MARVTTLSIKNYKSIHARVTLDFPKTGPLVIVGPNNTGKSNLMRAFEQVMGEGWPGSFQPDDHDFHRRDKTNVPIAITVELEALNSKKYGPIRAFMLEHDGNDCSFEMVLN